jgi:antitoxin (DNA-binding transcriptional repressor) of toxin-antitoxin stability system
MNEKLLKKKPLATKTSMTEYPLATAKAKLSELTVLVDRGEQVVIPKDGKAAYVLSAYQAPETLPAQYGQPVLPDDLTDEINFIEALRAKVKPDLNNSVELLRSKGRY